MFDVIAWSLIICQLSIKIKAWSLLSIFVVYLKFFGKGNDRHNSYKKVPSLVTFMPLVWWLWCTHTQCLHFEKKIEIAFWRCQYGPFFVCHRKKYFFCSKNYIAIIQNLIYKHKVLAHMLHVFIWQFERYS